MLTNFHGNEAKKNLFAKFFSKWPKLVNIYRIARIDQNFDDYPGFQQIPGMHILFQQSVSAESAAEVLFTP